jgi:hypothetical protein
MLVSPEFWDSWGDLARCAENMLIRNIAGKDLLIREALPRKLEAMRAELAGPVPSALESLVVARIAAGWLHLSHLEASYAGKDGMSVELATYYQRSISAAQKRYLAAMRTLAMIRKHALPALQVNVAQRQLVVNQPG